MELDKIAAIISIFISKTSLYQKMAESHLIKYYVKKYEKYSSFKVIDWCMVPFGLYTPELPFFKANLYKIYCILLTIFQLYYGFLNIQEGNTNIDILRILRWFYLAILSIKTAFVLINFKRKQAIHKITNDIMTIKSLLYDKRESTENKIDSFPTMLATLTVFYIFINGWIVALYNEEHKRGYMDLFANTMRRFILVFELIQIVNIIMHLNFFYEILQSRINNKEHPSHTIIFYLYKLDELSENISKNIAAPIICTVALIIVLCLENLNVLLRKLMHKEDIDNVVLLSRVTNMPTFIVSP